RLVEERNERTGWCCLLRELDEHIDVRGGRLAELERHVGVWDLEVTKRPLLDEAHHLDDVSRVAVRTVDADSGREVDPVKRIVLAGAWLPHDATNDIELGALGVVD